MGRSQSLLELKEVKAPKEVKTYCARCRMHTEHSLSLYKKGRERRLSAGARRYRRKKAGYGSQPKAVQKRFAKAGTKKYVIRYKCKTCGHTTVRKGNRLKKIEFV